MTSRPLARAPLLRAMSSTTRTVLLCGTGAVFIGCASMALTPTQELAYERWYKCNRFVSVTLERISNEGDIGASFEVTSEGRRWQACVRQVWDEQVKSGRLNADAHPFGDNLVD